MLFLWYICEIYLLFQYVAKMKKYSKKNQYRVFLIDNYYQYRYLSPNKADHS